MAINSAAAAAEERRTTSELLRGTAVWEPPMRSTGITPVPVDGASDGVHGHPPSHGLPLGCETARDAKANVHGSRQGRRKDMTGTQPSAGSINTTRGARQTIPIPRDPSLGPDHQNNGSGSPQSRCEWRDDGRWSGRGA
mmetsp:Transcript_82103/g.137205  ORF Transcript_82103/g.137205 Transcript_82103/m.137205 type:complete len:139 (+) Transcript_82103:17-433(+)